MNEITKDVIEKILELNIEGVEKGKDGSLWCGNSVIVGVLGDVNFTSWHENTLSHDCFKFSDTNTTTIKIETQEQADEFVDIVANYFGVEENEACELGTNSKDVEEALLEFSNSISEVDVLESNSSINYLSPIYRYNEEGELIQVLEIDKNDGLYKQVYPKLTAKERLDALYEEYLKLIVEELNEEYSGELNCIAMCNKIYNNTDLVATFDSLNDKIVMRFNYCGYFEKYDCEIENVKVKKRFNVIEELCKIEMPGSLHISGGITTVKLYYNQIYISTIFNKETRAITYGGTLNKQNMLELGEKFGNKLKPEDEKEFVKWIAEKLGGEYDA